MSDVPNLSSQFGMVFQNFLVITAYELPRNYLDQSGYGIYKRTDFFFAKNNAVVYKHFLIGRLATKY
jgi:hypothetical protein